MKYTTSKIEITRGTVLRSAQRVARQRQLVEQAPREGAFADQAQALLLVMEQSLLSMKRFLKTLEKDLAQEEAMAAGRQRLHRAPAPRARPAQPDALTRLLTPEPEGDRDPVKATAKSEAKS
jgi:hypothetical protein